MSDWTGAYMGLQYLETGCGDVGATGVHCWGLVRTIYRDMLNLELPPFDMIGAKDLRSVANKMTEEITNGNWVSHEGEWNRFDVIVMHGRSSTMRRARVHCGIAVNRNRFLHVEEATGVVNVRRDNPTVRFRLAGVYRHTDLMGIN